tara:strand:- start:113 stop:928 length:816 start_codon:yes stop_codon:yes gene_type:complete
MDAQERQLFKLQEIDRFGTLCPYTAKYGHTLVLIDTTMTLGQKRIDMIRSEIFNERNFRDMAPYDLISVYQMSGIEQEAAQNLPIIRKCRPPVGEKTKYKIDEGDDWRGPTAASLKTLWKRFLASFEDLSPIEEAANTVGDYSVIMESILEISRMDSYDFKDEYSPRKLIIFSDMLQNSQKFRMTTERNKGICDGRRGCPEWNDFKQNRNIQTLMRFYTPDFGDISNLEIEIHYMNAMYDPFLDKRVIEFWDGYFADAGISKVKWVVESFQ